MAITGFDTSTFPPSIIDLASHTITLNDRQGAPSLIRQIGSNQPNPALGCLLAPTGQQISEFNHRLDQLHQLTARIRPVELTILQAYSILHPRILPKITFSMAVTSLSNDQCRRLNTALDPTMLNKLHINQHAPKAALYSSLSRGGMDYPSFRIIQAQKGILTLMKHLRVCSTIGNDILVTLSAIQLGSGLCTPILEDTASDLTYLSKHQFGWFLHLREQLIAMNGAIWIEHQWTPSLQRENDVSLMSAIAMQEISTNDKMKANFCRLYSRVITIADLASEKGTRIPGCRLDGRYRAPSSRHWPNVPKPPPAWWTVYRTAIRRAFASNSRATLVTTEIKLAVPLGKWFDSPRNITYEHHRNARHAYAAVGEVFYKYVATSPRHFARNGTCNSLPPDVHPVTATHDENEYFTMYPYNIRRTEAPRRSLIQTTSQVQAPDMSGSDGSVDTLFGERACAYCLQIGGTRYQGSQRYPQSDHATSYRSELEGGYLTVKLMQEVSIPDGIDQYIDNSQSVNSMITRPNPNQAMAPEADIILAIHHELNSMPSKPNIQWLKAHQDDHQAFEDLTPSAQLNTSMDVASKSSRISDPVTQDTPYPGSGAMLIIKGKWVTTKYKEQIQDALMAKDHLDYFLKKYPDKNKQHYNSIYWHGIGYARSGLTNYQNINIFKLMNRWLNSGRQQGLFDQSPECVSCGWPEETILHMYQCNHPDARRTRKQAFRQLEKYYHLHKIPSLVYVPIIKLLRSACQTGGNEWDIPSVPELAVAIRSQQALGEDFILRGYLVKEWIPALLLYQKDKPDLRMKHIFTGIWTILFESVWETRNTIKHGGNTIVHAEERRTSLNNIDEWIRNKGNRLSTSQHYLLDFPRPEMHTWTNSSIKNLLSLLGQASTNYLASLLDDAQPLITTFFQPIEYTVNNDADDETPPHPPTADD